MKQSLTLHSARAPTDNHSGTDDASCLGLTEVGKAGLQANSQASRGWSVLLLQFPKYSLITVAAEHQNDADYSMSQWLHARGQTYNRAASCKALHMHSCAGAPQKSTFHAWLPHDRAASSHWWCTEKQSGIHRRCRNGPLHSASVDWYLSGGHAASFTMPLIVTAAFPCAS